MKCHDSVPRGHGQDAEDPREQLTPRIPITCQATDPASAAQEGRTEAMTRFCHRPPRTVPGGDWDAWASPQTHH